MLLSVRHCRHLIVCLGWLVVVFLPVSAEARDVNVKTASELRAAISKAVPGDTIWLADGTYKITSKLSTKKAGTAQQRIVVKAVNPGKARIQMDTVEGFYVSVPYWTFDGLLIEGVCGNHSKCEHAFHIVGKADFTVVRRCVMRNFNAQIKGNGLPIGPNGTYRHPNDVQILENELYNTTARNTSNPVTSVDIVGGRRWLVEGNYFHDIAKGGGNKISYAAFLKGNSRDGVFARNLVICEKLHTGQIRLGLSLGGGGTGPDKICEDASCNPEHQNGIIRNNIIMNCPKDVGIYLNEAKNCKIHHNILYKTAGIDVRFATSSCDLRYNLLTGRIKLRNGGKATQTGNIVGSLAQFKQWFVDPDKANFALKNGTTFVNKGKPLTDVKDDYCGNIRSDGKPDVGAIEFSSSQPCKTATPPFRTTPTPPTEPVAESVSQEPVPEPGREMFPQKDAGNTPSERTPAPDKQANEPGSSPEPQLTESVPTDTVYHDAANGSPEPSQDLPVAAGGCGCDASNGGAGSWLFALLCVVGWVSRKRLMGATTR